MAGYLITIDGGTTNTRAVLWDGNASPLHIVKAETGVKKSAEDGNNSCLKQSIKQMLTNLLDYKNLTYKDIAAIYASGMLTSNVGLYELPHLTAPAGIRDFAEHVTAVLLEDICPLPIHFIPGLKNQVSIFPQGITLDNIECMDIMRGEETETLALLHLFPLENGGIFVLPGSHTKFVAVNSDGNITGCLTSLAGELIEVMTKHTILADAVDKKFAPAAYDRDMLLAGSRSTFNTSLTRAAFLTRIVSQFISKDPCDSATFLLGAVLADDIKAVKASNALVTNRHMKVIIAGKEPLQNALKDIFREDGSFDAVHTFETDKVPPLSGYGAYLIAKMKKSI